MLNDWFIPCAIDFSTKMLVHENNFMFTRLGRLFFASTPPPRAAHHRHPKCGVLHGVDINIKHILGGFKFPRIPGPVKPNAVEI